MWSYLGEVDAALGANQFELSIPRSQLGNPTAIELYLRGDNGAIGTSNTVDFYPDAVSDSTVDSDQRRFRYQTAP